MNKTKVPSLQGWNILLRGARQSAYQGMARTRLSILLLLATTAGCTHLIAVTGDPQVILPEKAPGQVEPGSLAPADTNTSAFPRVVLSTVHTNWCRKFVGDAFPSLNLPRIDSRETAEVSSKFGSRATVVVFWTKDRWMSQMALEDLQRLVAAKHDATEVAIVGIAVDVPKNEARQIATKTQAEFPHFFDANGEALAEVGSVALPRLYVLDPNGQIMWFDIEYSESTRRELLKTVAMLAGTQAK